MKVLNEMKVHEVLVRDMRISCYVKPGQRVSGMVHVFYEFNFGH